MKIWRWALPLVVLGLAPLLYNNCAGGFAPADVSGGSSSALSLHIAGNEPNVLPITVGSGYVNEPTVTVTVCQPGGAVGSGQCTTVPNVLVDTQSFGLRVFSNFIPFSLTGVQDPVSGNPVAECFPYSGGNSDWGLLVRADVVLGSTGSERASNIPIQIINASAAHVPSGCTNPDSNPTTSGYNGVLGVGQWPVDCGDQCATDAAMNVYFACSSTTCTPITLADSLQLKNPISSLPQDNNGVIVQLPGLSTYGAATVSGYLILGIGTRTNNTPPSGVTVLTADQHASFQTMFNGQLYSHSYIDSGSNLNYFPDSALPDCQESELQGFFCPSGVSNLSGTQVNAAGTLDRTISFQVISGENLLATGYGAVPSLAGPATGTFAWGLPFFFGRTVYVGFDNTSSPLGAGPYWAY